MRSIFGTTKRATGALCICVALAMAAFGAGCGDDDDEPTPPASNDLTGPDGVEASSGVAISTVKSLSTLFNAGNEPTGGGLGKLSEMKPLDLAWAIVRARYDAAAKRDPRLAVLVDCPAGGTAESSCVEVAGVSAGTLSFDECKFQEEARTLTLNGTIAIGVADTNFCDTDSIPETGTVSISLNNFSATVRTLEGVQLSRFFADFMMDVENEGEGCFGNDASVMMDGTIDAIAPAEGVSAEITADNLSMSVSSTGDLVCIVTMVVDGGLTAIDRYGEREVHAMYDDLELEFTNLPNQRVDFTIEGGVHADCLGNISFETLEPVTFVGSAVCPVDGTIEVTLSDNTKGRFSFLVEGGIAFDYGADGTVDTTLASCNDDEIRDCEVAER